MTFTFWWQNHKQNEWIKEKKNWDKLERRQAVSYSSACGGSLWGGKNTQTNEQNHLKSL